LKKDFVIFGENNPLKIRYIKIKDRKTTKITFFLTFFSPFLKKCKKKSVILPKNVGENLNISHKLWNQIKSIPKMFSFQF